MSLHCKYNNGGSSNFLVTISPEDKESSQNNTTPFCFLCRFALEIKKRTTQFNQSKSDFDIACEQYSHKKVNSSKPSIHKVECTDYTRGISFGHKNYILDKPFERKVLDEDCILCNIGNAIKNKTSTANKASALSPSKSAKPEYQEIEYVQGNHLSNPIDGKERNIIVKTNEINRFGSVCTHQAEIMSTAPQKVVIEGSKCSLKRNSDKTTHLEYDTVIQEEYPYQKLSDVLFLTILDTKMHLDHLSCQSNIIYKVNNIGINGKESTSKDSTEIKYIEKTMENCDSRKTDGKKCETEKPESVNSIKDLNYSAIGTELELGISKCKSQPLPPKEDVQSRCDIMTSGKLFNDSPKEFVQYVSSYSSTDDITKEINDNLDKNVNPDGCCIDDNRRKSPLTDGEGEKEYHSLNNTKEETKRRKSIQERLLLLQEDITSLSGQFGKELEIIETENEDKNRKISFYQNTYSHLPMPERIRLHIAELTRERENARKIVIEGYLMQLTNVENLCRTELSALQKAQGELTYLNKMMTLRESWFSY